MNDKLLDKKHLTHATLVSPLEDELVKAEITEEFIAKNLYELAQDKDTPPSIRLETIKFLTGLLGLVYAAKHKVEFDVIHNWRDAMVQLEHEAEAEVKAIEHKE